MTIQKSYLAEKYSLDPEEVNKALEAIQTQKVILLAVSGKIGSGKDTIAPILMAELGQTTAFQTSYATPLKEELNTIIEVLRTAHDKAHAANAVHGLMNVQDSDALGITEILFDHVHDSTLTSYSRTKEIRQALQFWGTQVRRKNDPDYWVKKTVATFVKVINSGRSVFVTDPRFQNEVTAVEDFGGFVLRLDVSPNEQQRRIQARDGLTPSVDALTHSSEVALDSYPFDYFIETDRFGPMGVVNEAIVEFQNYSATLSKTDEDSPSGV